MKVQVRLLRSPAPANSRYAGWADPAAGATTKVDSESKGRVLLHMEACATRQAPPVLQSTRRQPPGAQALRPSCVRALLPRGRAGGSITPAGPCLAPQAALRRLLGPSQGPVVRNGQLLRYGMQVMRYGMPVRARLRLLQLFVGDVCLAVSGCLVRCAGTELLLAKVSA